MTAFSRFLLFLSSLSLSSVPHPLYLTRCILYITLCTPNSSTHTHFLPSAPSAFISAPYPPWSLCTSPSATSGLTALASPPPALYIEACKS